MTSNTTCQSRSKTSPTHQRSKINQICTKQKTTIYKSKMPGRSLGIILLQIEPILGLRQLVPFEINQGVCSFLKDFFNDIGAIPHRLKLSCPQGIFFLGIDQNKVTFRKNPRFDRLIVLNFDSVFMRFIHRGGILTLLIEMFQMKEPFFKTRSVRKKFKS